jgi:uncharacterized protein YkwD
LIVKILKTTLYIAGLFCAFALSLGGPVPAAQAGPEAPFSYYLPLANRPGLPDTVNLQDRQASVDLYKNVYLTSSGTANWSGSQSGCTPGTTDTNYKLAVLQRINYFRAMAGVPADITFSDNSNNLAQAAALMMSANGALNHNPPTSWKCYSSEGAQGAGSSNLALGVSGWDAISLYMKDPGSNNTFAGHRRWILYPRTRVMGTGDVPGGNGYSAANALRVFGDTTLPSRPATREEFVAWPPPGYVPYPVVFARWSFSYNGADFSAASVSMSSGGEDWTVSLAAPANGYGENTLVWIPNGMSDSAGWPVPSSDNVISVGVHNVKINGVSRDISYDVIVFNPGP